MKSHLRALCITSSLAVALLSAATAAHADTIITGSVWENATHFPLSIPDTTAGLGTPGATFTVDGINFVGTSGPSYTIAGFLAPNLLSFTNTGVDISGDNMNNTIYEFKGFLDLGPGTYTLTHDDGAVLWINGAKIIDDGEPTSADGSTFTILSDTGVVPFDLIYGEVNGSPGVLQANTPLERSFLNPAPEPSSFLLFGSGLVGAAGLVRRRLSR